MKIFEAISEKGRLRYVEDENGVVWFNATDVINFIGLDGHALDRVDMSDKRSSMFPTGRRAGRKASGLTEAGVYQLAFGSRTRAALEFKVWLTHEVLPSIRKNGGYIMGQENLDESELKALTDKVSQLAEEVASLTAGKEKVTAYLDQSDNIIEQLGKTVRHLLSVLAEHSIDPNPRKVKEVVPDDPRVVTKGGLLMRRSEAIAGGELFSLAP